MIPYPQISPTIIALGPLQVRWYGMMYILGFVFGYLLLKKRNEETHLHLDATILMDFAFYLFVGVLLGGRVGYILFYNPLMFAAHPLEIIQLWHGGMSFHGGMIGTILAGWFFCWQKGLSFYRMADTVMPAVPIGLALGRLGNFINGELWGRQTDVPWGMIFPGDPDGLVRHPSQLYELGMEGILLFTILFTMRRFNTPPGTLFWSFIMFYGMFRAFGEVFREPDAHLAFIFPGITAGMILCAPMIVGGLIMIVVGYMRRRPDQPLPQAG